MKILLDSQNSSISGVVSIACERVGAEFDKFQNDQSDYDLLIKDCENEDDILGVNPENTLFLLPKELGDKNFKFQLIKPFLPSDLINFLSENFSKNEQISEEMSEKIKNDMEKLSDIVKEIDELDSVASDFETENFETENLQSQNFEPISLVGENDDIKPIEKFSEIANLNDNIPAEIFNINDDEKTETKDDKMVVSNSILDNVINEFYLSNDQRPIEVVASDLQKLGERGFLQGDSDNLGFLDGIQSEIKDVEIFKPKDENFDFDMNFDEILKEKPQNENFDDFKKNLDIAIDNVGKKVDFSDIKLVSPIDCEVENEQEISLENENLPKVKVNFENAPKDLHVEILKERLSTAILNELKGLKISNLKLKVNFEEA